MESRSTTIDAATYMSQRSCRYTGLASLPQEALSIIEPPRDAQKITLTAAIGSSPSHRFSFQGTVILSIRIQKLLPPFLLEGMSWNIALEASGRGPKSSRGNPTT